LNDIFCGIDLGGTTVNIGLVTNSGGLVQQHKIPSGVIDGVDAVVDRIAKVIHSWQVEDDQLSIRAAGIGVAGLVDTQRGILREATNFPGWINVPLVSKIHNKLDCPVIMDNDANVAALGEYSFGAGKGYDHMMMVTLGTGVGAGLVLNGQIYRGANGAAGEFGHITIEKDGPLCGCGRRGCIEAFVGTNGLVGNVRQRLLSNMTSTLRTYNLDKLTPKDIYKEAVAGDELARLVFSTAGENLGYGLGSVVNLLNIQHIVIGGGVAEAGKFIIDSAQKILNEFALNNDAQPVRIVKAQLGELAGIVGAASLAMALI